ncbi:hypothetical protein NDS46_12760 [Paenibacillus thiaminolyticus]|uniref:hypothetical protein n=1 Tax=Paenibacillus thiaminolyticus TaxID=49283 RepID=UPI00232B1856|nr:hypothetical protein [Paenibacillus thiaminolyticus]WCF10657.1 hypothetical protein NDS46_12760 [Paenibacillus thiaminolyticus]
MYNDLRKIVRIRDSHRRNILLSEFFEKYSKEDSPLFKLNNSSLIENYYQLDDLYDDYIIDGNDEKWTEFWYQLYEFFMSIKKEYWRNFNVLYREHRWYGNIWSTNNYLYRFIKETIRFFVDTLNFICSAILVLFSCQIWLRIWGKGIRIPKEYSELIFNIVWLIFILWWFVLIIGVSYTSIISVSPKKGKVRIIFEKIVPRRIWSIFEDIKRREVKRLRKDIKVPERYYQVKQ